MKEWSKKVLAIIGSLLVVCLSFCSFSFISDAAVDVTEYVFCMPVERPDCDMDSGYVDVFIQNKSNDNFNVRSYYWSITGTSDNTEVWMDVKLWVSNDTVVFTPSGEVTWSLYEVKSTTGEVTQLISNATDSSYIVDLSSAFNVLSFHGYGNIESSYPTVSAQNFNVLWGQEAAQYTELKRIKKQLEDLNTSTDGVSSTLSSLVTKVNNIYSSVDTVETKLQNIYTLINSNLPTVLAELKEQGVVLDNIKLDTTNILLKLNDIYELLKDSAGSQESIPQVPSDEINDYYAAEDGLMLDSDISDSMSSANPNISASSNDLVWHIVNKFLAANPILMNLITVVCAAGLGALILGR